MKEIKKARSTRIAQKARPGLDAFKIRELLLGGHVLGLLVQQSGVLFPQLLELVLLLLQAVLMLQELLLLLSAQLVCLVLQLVVVRQQLLECVLVVFGHVPVLIALERGLLQKLGLLRHLLPEALQLVVVQRRLRSQLHVRLHFRKLERPSRRRLLLHQHGLVALLDTRQL